MSASQPTPQNPVPSGPIGPVTVPRGAKTPKRVGLIVLAVVVLMAGLAIGLSSLVRRPADFPPPPALPKVLDDPVVTEAIDLFKKPKLGEPWNASGGAVPKDMRATPFITPCGVLVNIVEADYSIEDAQLLGQTRIVGYDIASGQQKWSSGLQKATGLTNPGYDTSSSGAPTYTSDCHMVVNFRDQASTNLGATATLFIDLASGDLTTMAWPLHKDGACAAAGAGWAGCWMLSDKVSMAVKLDGSTKAAWTEPGKRSVGDPVVAGYILTEAGYRDPATGRVAFGADITTNDSLAYHEPTRPGGYDSGLVVRVSVQASEGHGQCQVTLWDPATDHSTWPTPETIDCDADSSFRWGVAGQALIVTKDTRNADNSPTMAYGLTDGALLWQRDGNRLGTGWDRLSLGDRDSRSLSESYVFLTYKNGREFNDLAIRIADGVETNLSVKYYPGGLTWSQTAAARIMGYDFNYSGLTAFAIDADKPGSSPSKAWSIPIDTRAVTRSTFATGGVMYLLQNLGADGLQITPLLSR